MIKRIDTGTITKSSTGTFHSGVIGRNIEGRIRKIEVVASASTDFHIFTSPRIENDPYGLDKNLQFKYEFEEGSGTIAYDSSTNQSIALLNSGVSYSTNSRKGKYSVLCDGVSGFINTQKTIPQLLTSDFTIAFWYKAVSLGTNKFIFSADDSGANRFYLNQSAATGALLIGIGDWNTTYAAAINEGEWYHIVVTLNGSDGYIYLNGVQLGTQSEISLSFPATILKFGSDYAGTNFSNCYFDDVRLYNRYFPLNDVVALYKKDDILGTRSTKITVNTTLSVYTADAQYLTTNVITNPDQYCNQIIDDEIAYTCSNIAQNDTFRIVIYYEPM